ncbi:MAG: MoaD/ThiS family protein [Gammaproteobacteria bacterium]
MKIEVRLLFFGRLRERLQTSEETMSAEAATVADVLAVLRARGGVWGEELDARRALGFAVGRRFARTNSPVQNGDEIAIFPPVTGG